MSDEKFVYDPRRISGMTPVATITGNELLEVIQEGKNKQAPISLLKGGKGDPGFDGKNAYELALIRGFVGTMTEWLASIEGTDGQRGLTGIQGVDGLSAYELAVAGGFNGTLAEWIQSIKGVTGKSAYQIAVENGYQGTSMEWLATLRGPVGKTGPIGEPGVKGNVGPKGFSAFEVAVNQGYTGTINDWLFSLTGQDGTNGASAFALAQLGGFVGTIDDWFASLAGRDGIDGNNGSSAYEVAKLNGYIGTLADWLLSLKGDFGATGSQGQSAYDIAVANGFVGTEADWLISLAGGINGVGASAYQLAVAGGYVGTEAEWLASLKGDTGITGKSAYELAVINGFNGTETEWLASLRGNAVKIEVVDFTAFDINMPAGFAAVKEYSDSSIKITHGLGKEPLGWFAVSKDSVPAVGIYPSSTRNMQVLDANNVIITNVSAFTKFDIYLYFGEQVVVSGAPGLDGTNGSSAYEIAVANGYVGTPSQWLLSLKGIAGTNGTNGTDGAAGSDGIAGVDGLSAYQVAVNNGFVGTEPEWLASIKGNAVLISVIDFASLNVTLPLGFTAVKDYSDSSIRITHNLGQDPTGWFALGKDSIPNVGIYPTSTRNMQVVDANSVIITNVSSFSKFDIYLYFNEQVTIFGATGADGADGLPGAAGSDGLPGLPGDPGDSAYNVAVTNGYVGTEAEWLASLKGNSLLIEVTDFATLAANVPAGMSIVKEYSDSSLSVTHNQNKQPVGWFAISKDTVPAVAIYSTSTRNMQVVDNNTIVITNISSFTSFDLYLHFGDKIVVTADPGLDGATGPAGADGVSAYELAVATGFVGTEAEWLASLVGPVGPAGTGGTGDGLPVRGKFTVTNNGVSARINISGFGTQADMDALTLSTLGGSVVEITNIAVGLLIIQATISYDAGFNSANSFTLRYPEPYGDTSVIDMNIPVFFVFSQANPSVMQSTSQQNYQNNAGIVDCQKAGLLPNVAYRWKFIMA